MSDEKILDFLYNTIPGRCILKVLVSPVVSKAGGLFLSSRLSGLYVDSFVKKHGIDMAGCEKKSFRSFNDFFTRRQNYDICGENNCIISPCDGYLSTYKIDGGAVLIKNCTYTIAKLLRSRRLAERFDGGYCLIFRLEPVHYHRYIYIADAKVKCNRRVDGVLHCVRPVALDKLPVYIENSREYTVMKNRELGLFVQMEVGALLVGKIHNHDGIYNARKGMEKGYFEFGGSTIVVLLEKDRVRLDERFESNLGTEKEIPVKIGEKIGKTDVVNDGGIVWKQQR